MFHFKSKTTRRLVYYHGILKRGRATPKTNETQFLFLN